MVYLEKGINTVIADWGYKGVNKGGLNERRMEKNIIS